VASNAPVLFRVPTDSTDDATWTQTGFSGQNWQAGLNGIGYETGIIDPLEQSFATNILQSGPIAYWRLNETNGPAAVNIGSKGVEYEAGYQGDITLGVPGPRPPEFPIFEQDNLAPYFNGTDAYVNGPYELLDDMAEFTLAGWIKPTSAPAGRTGLFGQNDAIEFGFHDANTLALYPVLDNGNFGVLEAPYSFPVNEWHFVTATGGNGLLAIYVDGILVASTPVSTSKFGASEYDFNIGGGGVFDESGNFFCGQLDEVAVWDRMLSSNEVAALVSGGGQVDYAPLINTDVRTPLYNSNSTVYVRIPFSVADPLAFVGLKLLVRYDDGFVAYLNGHEIARANAPDLLAWNSTATQRHPDTQAVLWEEFDESAARSYLQAGSNVLAIQALNISPTNKDFFIQAQLLAQSITDIGNTWRYFTQPTPGGLNAVSSADQGPILYSAGHSPLVPLGTDPLVVTSRIAQAFNAVSNVTLHYRVMFDREVSVSMNDSGTNGDAAAGDGIWTGIIPAGLASAGQMIRYYVTASDTATNTSRWPIFPSASDSEQYYGTVVANSSIHSQLPVAHLFMQSPSSADTAQGTQGSLFYLNEFYDNLNVSVHGQSSTGWPKKSHNLDFPNDHRFLYQTNGSRVSHIILMSNYGDKSRLRTSLTYSVIARSGAVAFFSFPVRIQQNGSFWGIEDMVERGDDLFLNRIGRDPNGALYKMYNNLASASGNEKKTREWEGTADLTALVTNLDEALPLATRTRYAYDHLDLPQLAGFFATTALVSDQDFSDKNYYLYHDNDGTGEWSVFLWDVDLTWGRNWVMNYGSSNYLNDVLFQTNVLNFNPGPPIQYNRANRLVDLFVGSPDFRQMYLRRLRTLMDTVLMPTGTPSNQLVIEPIIRQYESILNPPGISPSDTALDYSAWGPFWGSTTLSQFPNDAERLISLHLAGRRNFLFTSNNATLNGDPIPAAQPTNAVVYIASWDYNPASGSQNEQYVELRNTNAYAVDVSNWELSGAIGFTLRPGTVIPSGKSLFLSPNVNAFRARAIDPGGNQNLYVQGAYGGFLSAQGNSPLLLRNSSGWLVASNSYAASGSSVFTAGNLAVLRLGDGAESLSSHGNSVFIDQFTTNGTFIGSIPIPDDGTNALIISGSASSEGALTRSADGRLLTLAGYHIAQTNSSSSLANSASATVPRVLGVVDRSGAFALAGVTTNQYSGNNIRSGTTDGRGNYWGAGATSGTYYFGNGIPATVQNTVSNTVVIQDIGGDLYFGTSKSTPGIWKMAGAPTAGLVTPSVYLATGSGSSPYAFAFNPDFTTVYVADDTLAGSGGVQRWDYNGSAWAMSYAFNALTNVGARGLAVDFSGAHPLIYATTAESTFNRLVVITDMGVSSAVTTLATAGVNQIFHGMAFAPVAANAPQFLGFSRNGNSFTLVWTAFMNRPYRVQYTSDLGGTNWITLTNVTATMPVLTVTDMSASGGTNRFYRAILNP
jgi:hypothetical protein